MRFKAALSLCAGGIARVLGAFKEQAHVHAANTGWGNLPTNQWRRLIEAQSC
jgi:hypothetical protein